MAKFVVRKKTNKTGGTEEVRYYAISVTDGIAGVDELAQRIQARCTLTEGDVKAVITELSHSIRESLKEGYSVHLEGIGYFTVSASSEGYEDPAECTSRRVIPKRVCFRADKKMRALLKTIKFTPRNFVSKSRRK